MILFLLDYRQRHLPRLAVFLFELFFSAKAVVIVFSLKFNTVSEKLKKQELTVSAVM